MNKYKDALESLRWEIETNGNIYDEFFSKGKTKRVKEYVESYKALQELINVFENLNNGIIEHRLGLSKKRSSNKSFLEKVNKEIEKRKK